MMIMEGSNMSKTEYDLKAIMYSVNISVLNGALWDMEQVHSEICELSQFYVPSSL